MGIIERKERLREQTRRGILEAAMTIVKLDGWQSLSMRRIADLIEYSAPTIYEHFLNKDALLSELTQHGFLKLARLMKEAMAEDDRPDVQMEYLWLAYWDFAFTEESYYQLMFGVKVPCCEAYAEVPAKDLVYELVKGVLRKLIPDQAGDEQIVLAKYYVYWAMVHGLVSINLINKGGSQVVAKQLLIAELGTITHTLTA